MEPIKTLNYNSGTSNVDYNQHTIYNNPVDYTYSGFSTLTNNNNNIMQNKVAVFKITRDENQKITSSKFIKELWIESKNGSSIDFEVAKDPEISKFEANEIIIKVINTVIL